MKKLSIALLFTSLIVSSCTYNEGVSKAFSKYRNENGIIAITVPGFAIRIASLIADLDEREEELLASIDRVKVLAVDDDRINASVNFHEEFAELIQQNEYEELLVVKSDDQSATIVGKITKEGIIKEMVVLVGGDDNALVYIKGSIRPELLNDYINESDHEELLSFKGFGF